MLRLRGSPLVLGLLFACARKPEAEPLSSYGSERLTVMRGTDYQGTPIVYAYLFPPGGDDDCPPLAPVRATIDGRTLLSTSGSGGRTCFGPSFQAPLVVLRQGVDFHDLSIADDGAEIRARIADLGSDAKLEATSTGDGVRLTFDHFVRGRVTEARATWSGVVRGDVALEPDAVVASVPPEIDRSGRVVLAVDVTVALEITSCEGIAACESKWLVHEVFDVSVSR